ncbi:MAG: 16S rRNA (uracil(1498)-N(3))-methyltransferase [Rikenellaceae bacterium]
MQLFYAPDFTTPSYTLSEDESKHAIRVLRAALGHTLHITDGKGNLFHCRIIDANPKRCVVEVMEHIAQFEQLPYRLTIAVAPTKSIERFELFLEKATEIGIDAVVPLLTAHSERKAIKHDREERVITSAVKQSLKAYHPTLHAMISFAELLSRPFEGAKFIAHCESAEHKAYLADVVEAGGDVLILIGPEGDFSPQEIEQAKAAGFREISLGKQRLRTETAAIVATTIVSVKNSMR